MSMLAKAQTKIGDTVDARKTVEEAIKIAGTIVDDYQSLGALFAIVEASSELGKIEREIINKTLAAARNVAQKAIHKNEHPGFFLFDLKRLVKVFAVAGEADAAESVAYMYATPLGRKKVLFSIAETLAANGHVGVAREVYEDVVYDHMTAMLPFIQSSTDSRDLFRDDILSEIAEVQVATLGTAEALRSAWRIGDKLKRLTTVCSIAARHAGVDPR